MDRIGDILTKLNSGIEHKKQYRKEWHYKNKERNNQISRDYYEKNKERILYQKSLIYKMSSWKQKFNKKYGFDKDEPHSKEEIAKITKIKKKILDEVYDRGVGAWENNIRSVRLKSGKKDFSVTDRSKKMTAQQWAMARIYSFVMGGKTQKTADADLWEKTKRK